MDPLQPALGGAQRQRRNLAEVDAEARRAARNTLIALNLCETLNRSETCRLALELDRWWGGPPILGEHHYTPLPQLSAGQLRTARALTAGGETPRVAEEEARARDHRATLLTLADPDYPAALLDLDLPPPVLYVRGELPSTPAVALVGPRNADRWALRVAGDFASILAGRGLAVVSGFARGVDVAAHRAAIEPAGGRTVAVLGCGLGVPYPRQHHGLVSEIGARGAVVTEFPIGLPPRAWHFPVRNRLIAALSAATLVIQASRRSGSLITAREAAALGREVLALPGRLDDRRCQGSNLLLRDGAHLVLEPDDVIDALPLYLRDRLPGRRDAVESGGGPRDPLLAALAESARTLEELSELLDYPTPGLLARITELELDGTVERTDAARWRLAR